MKPPGSSSLRQPGCGRRPALLPLLGRLVSLLLLLHGSSCPRARAAAGGYGGGRVPECPRPLARHPPR